MKTTKFLTAGLDPLLPDPITVPDYPHASAGIGDYQYYSTGSQSDAGHGLCSIRAIAARRLGYI